MPKAPSPRDLFCTALYTLTGGKLKGLMVATMADRLGITFETAEALAAECAGRGWLAHEVHTVALRGEGFDVARRAFEAASKPRASALTIAYLAGPARPAGEGP
jgi:hypothetical protein